MLSGTYSLGEHEDSVSTVRHVAADLGQMYVPTRLHVVPVLLDGLQGQDVAV